MPEGWGRERNTHSWFVPAIARARVAVPARRWGPPAAGARRCAAGGGDRRARATLRAAVWRDQSSAGAVFKRLNRRNTGIL